jgi:hypothetical protein
VVARARGHECVRSYFELTRQRETSPSPLRRAGLPPGHDITQTSEPPQTPNARANAASNIIAIWTPDPGAGFRDNARPQFPHPENSAGRRDPLSDPRATS